MKIEFLKNDRQKKEEKVKTVGNEALKIQEFKVTQHRL